MRLSNKDSEINKIQEAVDLSDLSESGILNGTLADLESVFPSKQKKSINYQGDFIDLSDLSDNSQKIVSLFKDISLPFVDKEGGLKLEFIQAWLNERNIQNEYTPGIGLVVNKQEKPRIILVSHIDLIRKFQKGFQEGNVYKLTRDKDKDKDFIYGALDNTITNACALLSLDTLLSNDISDVELLLSEGEEVGFIGIKGYLKTFPEKSKNTFFLNLDVTNEGVGKSCSVEYDKPNFDIFKQTLNILDSVDNFKTFSTGEREGDDTDAVLAYGYSGYSYCLPTHGNIHSYSNRAHVESLVPYLNGLKSLLSELIIPKDPSCDFNGIYLKKAKKCDSLKKLNKKIKKIKDKQSSYSESMWGRHSTSDYQPSLFDSNGDWLDNIPSDHGLVGFDEQPSFDIDDNQDYLNYEESTQQKVVETLILYGFDSDLLFNFVAEHIALNKSFESQELIGSMPDITLENGRTDSASLKDASVLIDRLTYEGFIVEIFDNVFKFVI